MHMNQVRFVDSAELHYINYCNTHVGTRPFPHTRERPTPLTTHPPPTYGRVCVCPCENVFVVCVCVHDVCVSGMGHGRFGWLEEDPEIFFSLSADRNRIVLGEHLVDVLHTHTRTHTRYHTHAHCVTHAYTHA